MAKTLGWLIALLYTVQAALGVYHVMRSVSRWRGTSQEPATPASVPVGAERRDG